MRIVVALDGGESTKAVFERACTLVQRGRDVLVLLSVAEHAFPSYGEGYQQALMQANKRADARAREIVQCYAKKAAALNISAEECTPSGDPRLAIVCVATCNRFSYLFLSFCFLSRVCCSAGVLLFSESSFVDLLL
eukprot:TRINITY_DN1396_c0_g1_i3.p1 TRINITY_DN1396_c0_g1~~TRINITY_DN1396_c0_g1_i3.p1  ORF type:complete len:159 (-),score=31.94 TRINITY_DN1396_c0_g1_i3:417-824(-)